MLSRIVELGKGLLPPGHAVGFLNEMSKIGRLLPFRAYGGFLSRTVTSRVKYREYSLSR